MSEKKKVQGEVRVPTKSKEGIVHRPEDQPKVSSTDIQSPTQLKDWVQEKVQTSILQADLPSTEELTSSLAAARDSKILEDVKELPLSKTGSNVVHHAETLIDATEKLLSEKSKHDEVQQMLRHGALAAQKLKETSSISESISETFGEASAQASKDSEEVSMKTQQFMHVMFDVTRLLVSSSEFRNLLQQVAGLAGDYFETLAASVDLGETVETGKLSEKEQPKQKKMLHEAMMKLRDPMLSVIRRLEKEPKVKDGAKSVLELFILVRDRISDFIEKQREKLQEVSGEKLGESKSSATLNLSEMVPEDQEIKQHIQIASESAQQLIANFGGSLEPLQKATENVIDALRKKQPVVDDLLGRLQNFIEKPEEWEEKGSEILDRLRGMVENDSEMANSLRTFSLEGKKFVESIREDEAVIDVQSALENLIKDLFLDESGKPKLKEELFYDLKKVMPGILQRLTTIPVGRIDYSSDEADFICDNVILNCVIAPKNASILTETHVATDTGKVVSNAKLELRNVQVDAKNLVFYYYKKTFPSLVDVGIADLLIKGKGLDIELSLKPSSEAGHLFEVVEANTTIHELDLNIKRSRHGWLLTILRPLVDRIVRQKLQSAIEERVCKGIERIDETVEAAIVTGTSSAKTISQGIETAAARVLSASEE